MGSSKQRVRPKIKATRTQSLQSFVYVLGTYVTCFTEVTQPLLCQFRGYWYNLA